MKKEIGILLLPLEKIGKSVNVVSIVQSFYEDDEYSKTMSDKKDYVSVGKGKNNRIQVQKRLLFCNLKELYSQFKVINPGINLGIFKVCILRPKWSESVGASGAHSVCVYVYHQNSVLLLYAMKWDITYKHLMKKVVCDISKNECMVHRCLSCPGTDVLQLFLLEELEELDFDDELSFNQWRGTDRTQLVTQTETVKTYIELVVKCIGELTARSYISKCQTKFLKDLKLKLNEKECIVICDFSENYEFIVQDEIQSYHWCKSGCTQLFYTIK
ncbi:uncharacterized protein LOC136091404 [Hydra vulgaris]|uniref:Uncharacterized protein LOC136091404 n=1 Tax=Hydra vulgaris TaxID=6087 RepID=A0ABM4DKE7_HYDVU